LPFDLALGWSRMVNNTACLHAVTNELADQEEIPPLRPPKPELLPTFWEQHGVLILVLSVLALLLLALLWNVIRRKRPPLMPAPAETARTALAGLEGRAVDVRLHDDVSAILRFYFVSALNLSGQALTNRELCNAIDHAGPEACVKARLLLLALDQHRFDPELHQPVANAVDEALAVVKLTEAHLHPPQSGASTEAVSQG